MSALAAANAQEVPFTVAKGTATFASSADNKTITITQTTPRAVLDWSEIVLPADETLNFVQPNNLSITLNRSTATTTLPFQIDGTVNANGQVWILNPKGTIIGSTGSVNAAGFLATTASIDPDVFMANSNGSFVFSGATEAAITNEGQINVPSGYAVLAGRNVENRNSGALISASLGKIALGGGRDFTIDFAGNGLVSFLVADPAAATAAGATANFSNSVSNGGKIVADGGTILMTVRSAVDIIGNVINNEGIVQAQTVSDKAGVITLDAGPNGLITVGSSSVGGIINASGGASSYGGKITLAASSIDINAASQLLANGGPAGVIGGSTGGTIILSANPENSQSSMQIAGTLKANGGVNGGNGGTIDIKAYSLNQTSSSTLQANAGSTGTGGKINLLANLGNSQPSMQIAGTLEADGGTFSGDGGTIDIQAYSLNQTMTASARAKTAAMGLAGNINITSASIDVLGMTPLSLGDNNVAANVPLGFSFNYNGAAYTSVDVSSNGFLTFGNLSAMNSDNPSYCCEGLPLSSASAPRNSVFALWTDLIDLTNPYYTTTVIDGKKRFTLGYYGAREFDNNNINSFEIVLDEKSGRIQFNYGDLKILNHSVTAGVTGTGLADFTNLFQGTSNANTGLLPNLANKSFEYSFANANSVGAFQLLNSVPILPTGHTKILASQVETWLNSGANVTLRAQNPTAATTDGNVTINAPINKSAGPMTTLSLGASGDVVIANGVNITAQSGLSVALQSDSNVDGSGSVKLAGTIDTGVSIAAALQNGLIGTKYDGYFDDQFSFFDTATKEQDTRFANPFTAINTTTLGVDFYETYSVNFSGFFRPDVSGVFTFRSLSDDASYIFLGNAGETVQQLNARLASTPPIVNNGGIHGPNFASGQTASLNAGLFYPMIVLFG